jgi:UDP-N-acetylglucosamine 3-dehydrogenase
MTSSAAEVGQSPRPLNLAFLGCGAVTRMHSRTLAHFRREVCCFYASRDRRKAADLGRRYGGFGAFGSYAEALADRRIDAVLIATPPASHLDLTLKALEAGRNVIVEKPAFLASSDFAAVWEAEQRTGKRVLVAENYCYKPLARELRSIVSSGALGEVRFVQLNAVKYQRAGGWRADPSLAGGGALFEGGVHWLDLMANLGLRVESVQAFRPGGQFGAERNMLVVLQYEEGAIGTLHHSWDAPSPLQWLQLSRIQGTRGSVVFEANGLFVAVTTPQRRVVFPGFRDLRGYRAMFRDFFRALRSGEPAVMTLERAQRDVELVEAAYQGLAETAPSRGGP